MALEDLSGIRDRTTVRSGQRDQFGKWAFGQLRSFVEYKARMHGIPVILVDPRHTSRQCSRCGHIDRKNRKSQSEFQCVQCSFSLNADGNAAINIARRASVNTPVAV
ncbi:MAG: transposase [Nitrospirae bacterium]|nr:transposase [Nitrospirota bacterium]MCL5285550.1 transposase [Nitrospirota bacterium]